MHIRWLAGAVLLVFVVPGVLLANIERLSEREHAQLSDLRELVWVDKLSEHHAEEVLGALESERTAVLIEAIKVVAIHRLDAAASTLQGMASHQRTTASAAFGRIVYQGLGQGAEMGTVLRESLADSLMGDELRGVHSETKPYEYVRGMVTFVLVAGEVRSLRSGLTTAPDIEALEIPEREKLLLDYARMNDQDAITDIIANLRTPSVISIAEHDLVAVLQTYGADAVDAALDELSVPERVSEMSGYGKTIMLRYLRSRVPTMEDQDVGRLRGVVESLKSDAFAPLAGAIEAIESEIEQGE